MPENAPMSLDRRVQARDRGLTRISRLTAWVAGGGMVLSAVLAGLAAHGFTGASGAATVSATSGSATTSTTPAQSDDDETESDDDEGTTVTTTPPNAAPLQTPDTVPQVVDAPPSVVSGGS